MRSFFLSIIFVSGFFSCGWSQHKVDSLLHILPKAKDQKRIEVLTLLCYELAYVNADSARDFGLQAADLITDKSSVLYAEVLHNLAITHQVQSNYAEALRYDEQALQVYQSVNDSLRVANTINNMGLIYDEQGRYKEAIDYYRKAYEIYKERNDNDKIAVVALNLGVVYKGIGDFENSILNYTSALAMFSRLKHAYGIGVCHVNMGSVFLSLPQYDSALKHSLLAEKMFHDLTYKRFEAVAIGNAGIAYGKLNQQKKGIAYLEQAIALHEANSTRKELSFCYLKLAELYVEYKQYNQALSYALKALAGSLDAGVLQQVADTHKLLAALYTRQGNYRSALASQQAYAQVHDSLFQLEKLKHVREFQIQYETERKERELAEANVKITLQELKVQERNNQLILATAVVIFIAIGGLIVYRNQHMKQQGLQLKAELAEARTINAIQDERLRISQELHDNIGSQLTFVNASIETLEKSGNDNRFSDIKKLTTSAIHELRKTVWLINKQSATVDEFVIKLREYIPASSTPPVKVSTSGNMQIEIQANMANHVFRIVQEAVNNAIKHAQATQIQVLLTVSEKAFKVEIIDNGIGFDPTATTSGFGLRNIEKRIKMIYGTISIQSKPSETVLTLSIPW